MLRTFLAVIAIILTTEASRSQPTCKPGAPDCRAPVAKTTPTAPLDRDAQRRSEINALQAALEAYSKKNGGSYVVQGAGSQGQGWISYNYDGRPSVAQTLAAQGFLKSKMSDSSESPNYMIYLCANNRYSIFATLDKPSATDAASAQGACNAKEIAGPGTQYKKNYAVGN